MSEFMTTQSLNGGTYGTSTFNQGFNKTVQQVRKYDKTLLAMLNAGEVGAYRKYLMHKEMPKQLGDILNVRRYFDLDANPTTLGMDKETITGPELKKIQGASVEAQLS